MGIDLDKITEKNPDTTRADEALRKWDIDPNNPDQLIQLPKKRADELMENSQLVRACIIRPRQLTFSFGPEHPVGSGFINRTSKAAEKELGWEDKVGTKTSFSISTSASASFMGTFKVSITASFGMEWSTEKTFSDRFKINLDVGEYGWLTRRGMTSTVEADFYYPVPFADKAWTWTGKMEGYCGNDGRPDSWITGYTKKLDSQLLNDLEVSDFATSTDGGLTIAVPLFWDTDGAKDASARREPEPVA